MPIPAAVLAGTAAAMGLLLAAAAAAHDLSGAPQHPRNVLPPETLRSVDLGKEIPGMDGRLLRMRRLTLLPGGAIPPHSHADRPAIVYILQGRVREHRSDHETPVEYGAGDSMTENAALHHWIENIGNEPLVGVVVDLANEGGAPAFTADEILKAYGRPNHVHE
jgi:quercetin dioxygenase-like cupin family protein